MKNDVVAHFLDGRLVKGTSLDVAPNSPKCHVKTEEQMVEVELEKLKALFFVRDLNGDHEYNECLTSDPNDMRLRGTKRIELTFHDGERLVGLTNRFPPIQPYFFVLPIDANSNNIRVLVNKFAVENIKEHVA
jgi:hypothetical protein